MKTRSQNTVTTPVNDRGGSTLVIVIALLGLLMFLGMVFYTFASQERAAAEFFTEAAKAEIDEPPNVFDHMLRHVIVGPSDRPSERGSILRSPDRHHSMISNLVGSDLMPHNGDGIRVSYIGGLPVVDQDLDGIAEPIHHPEYLNFVDSPAARLGNEVRSTSRPAPDVDYTYPDINNLFLAYRGSAIRDNGSLATPRFEAVPVIIPSFFRPQYMKSSTSNGNAGENVLTDANWATLASDRVAGATPDDYSSRSFRPDNSHIAGFQADGVTPVYRYLTDAEAAGFGLASAGFPFLPEDEINSGFGTALRGELGIWTGSNPVVYELDADNDGDGTKEGIWLDLHFPVQEHTDSGGSIVKYVVLHSVTIYDLDSLIDLNVHGNLAGLDRNANFRALALAPSGAGNVVENRFLSRSNQGLGPNEINPLWALRNSTAVGTEASKFIDHFSALPTTDFEKANFEWMWLLGGRAESSGQVFAGRWGEADRLYRMIFAPDTTVSSMPRPGRTQNAEQDISSGIRFGGDLVANGRNGFDDNQDAREGEIFAGSGRIRGFGTPMDFAGTGRIVSVDTTTFNSGPNAFSFAVGSDPLLPVLHHDTASTGPERWLGYNGYSMIREVNTGMPRYIFGQNGVFDNGAGDDLIANPFLDALFEDPLESIFDPDLTDRDFDTVFGAADVLTLQMSAADIAATSSGQISTRMSDLAPVSLARANEITRERFTTVSNSLRKFMYKHQLGPDLQFGTADDGPRAWENTADSDGADNNNDGLPDGDGYREFPPVFGPAASKIRAYSSLDPFRPQVRRMLTSEVGESRQTFGQLPISINHILDVERNPQTPAEGTGRFLQYMQRTGLRFRPLTEHPDMSEGASVLSANAIPVWSAATPVAYPPSTVGEREFWARRDRQKMARDIFVLLYTTGGAQLASDGSINIRDYTQVNDPNSTLAGSLIYDHHQLRKMAQFAVNLVDAMDTDNVVTKFEYDKNLGDGWNLDDDAFSNDGFVPLSNGDAGYSAATGDGLYPEDSNERGVVFGVEAQELAFSEVQGIRSPEIGAGDHESTPFDDQAFARDFMYVELQNMSPKRVELGTSVTNVATNAIWRIARFDRASNVEPLKAPTAPDRAIAFMPHADNIIDGGGRFSIATSSDTGLATSAFFIDTGTAAGAWDGTYELVVPDANIPTLPTSANTAGSGDVAYADPLFDLDLIHTDHNTPANSRFVAVGGDFLSTTIAYPGNQPFSDPADTYDGDFTASGDPSGFDLVVQRRLNPNMPQLPEADNPWVEVDRIRVTLRVFNINDTSTTTDVFNAAVPSGRLTEITSFERSEPLSDRTRQPSAASTTTTYRYNSFKGGLNAASNDMRGVNFSKVGGQFLVRQDHFDRDFATPVELLNVPVIGPNLLTQRMERMRFPAFQQTCDDPANPSVATAKEKLSSNAEAMFLGPNFPDTGASPITQADSAKDNRWYRLFQFVEVPSRVHRMLGNYVNLDRVPGKLNVNMLRHLEVFAGMVDNPMFADMDNDRSTFPFLQDSSPIRTATSHPVLGGDMAANLQDRWVEYLTERDGVSVSYDPVNSRSAHFWLPGTPNSKPFRSPGFTTGLNSENGLEDTLFRTMRNDRNDGQPVTNRHWLEVGSQNVHQAPATYTTAAQRHQILSKIVNNTTTVSNTFIMYSTAAYFEAYEDPATGLVRVGGRYDLDEDGDPDNDQQRAVFVIDRTEALKAYDPGTGDFNWERLVKHRVQIE
ncbi:MAG: hypothetical protein JNL58_07260 [Planctomyces sp.]|nr:hypothetical protein [Planctomyces sp.]